MAFAAIAVMGIGSGCSSSSSPGGTGGAGGTTAGGHGGSGGTQAGGTTGGTNAAGGHGGGAGGQAGAAGGHGGAASGGHGGSAGAGQGGGGAGGSGAGGQDGGTLAMCASSVADQAACNSDPSCLAACGVDISALTTEKPGRTCTCSGSTASGGKWSCPSTAGACAYPTDIDLSCFQIPASPPACPTSSPDGGTDGGTVLLKNHVTSCDVPNSEVCGNFCGSASSTAPSYQDSTGASHVGYCVCIAGVWQCSSVNDWPKP
jgi:hypothetical protein